MTGLTIILALLTAIAMPLIALAFADRTSCPVNEPNATNREKIRRAAKRLFLARQTELIKESAILYGIDSNEADIDIQELLEYREMIQKHLGKRVFNKIQRIISSGDIFVSTKAHIRESHNVNRMVNVSELVDVSESRIIHVVRMGGDSNDGEANIAA